MSGVMTKNIKLLLLGLIQQGVEQFVISPGSRSTPVVLILAELAKKKANVKLFVDVDERSASFFGLGLAKDSHQPVALICTSGTAATEYSSAVAEAKLSNLPLIVITTDRPMELTNIGAPQAIDQVDLYGNNTKYFTQLQVQDNAESVSDFISFESQRIVLLAKQDPKAPVQINLPLRKPLMPEFETPDPTFQKLEDLSNPTKIDFSWLKQFQNKKVMLIAGPTNTTIADELVQLSHHKNWPLVSDILSNTRGFEVIENFDLTTKLLDSDSISNYQPDLVLKFGATLVSANISNWLKNLPTAVTIVNCSNNGLSDHTLSSNKVLFDDPKTIVTSLLETDVIGSKAYFEAMEQLDQETSALKTKIVDQQFSEMSLPKIMGEHSSDQANFFISNSMPVRDFENYFAAKAGQSIYCNRGANGIDGVVSTALGTAMRHLENYLLIGDLAMFHDMNGLMMAKRYQIPITIVVVNNDGGGIFSFLPQATAKDYFEMLFGTPQDINIEKMAYLYDFSYFDGSTSEKFKQALASQNQQKIIEVTSDRNNNLQQHQDLEKTLQKELNDFVRNQH
ncbi:2-succinyl-5-enolpyruvyl-6-hydroxy-3-cyclohexene-1-carboxylic-acid synthase [Companilactobacillus furfuricola]|uniref:2-succinyl-5-enolpyruvyl-6-hydroxy-3- cyclohexene-1-carboxylic-acid synthase n=1 Tax=Companilactobacillus furfuricola TaxID=1462575 RepID=UPI000F77DBA5|nr:2-succinyl-5-enolpyruvyl-6-hydroxy-3-cyclohexene-1-carboxylic-acid synthase [Companilactobacillus furfuricola]